MAQRQVVTLVSGVPQLQVPQAGDTYIMPRDVEIVGNLVISGNVDGRNVSADGTKLDFITVTQGVDLDAMEIRVNDLDAAVVLRGTWDASAGTFPGGGTAQAGSSYIVSVAGTVDTVAFAVGDRIIAITDNASTGTYAANWFKADYTDLVTSVNGGTGAVVIPTLATDTLWDAAGDIVQGTGANTAARLPIGTALQQLRVNAGATALEYFTASGGTGDFKADGTVDMSGQFRTDVGTFDSDVADGASAVAYDYDTQNTFSTAGGKLARWRNNATEKFAITKDGYIMLPDAATAAIYTNNSTAQADRLFMVNDNAGNSVVIAGRNANAVSSGSVAIGLNAAATSNAVVIGANAAETGGTSVVVGVEASSTAAASTTLGPYSRGVHHFSFAMSGQYFAVAGDNQCLLWQPSATTADATPALLWLDEVAATKRMTVASGKLYAFQAHIVGVQSDGTDACYYIRNGIIANNSGTTALIGAVQIGGVDIESNVLTDVAITANNTNDCLDITVTGIAAETWRWSANVYVKDITIGT